MSTKVFLQGFNSKQSSNTSEGLNIQFKGKRKLLPLNDISEVISQYDTYVDEREKCNIIRLTCQVNPICSNVLFNDITEIIKDEGTDNVASINYGVGGSLFDNVLYKPRIMSYWSSGDIAYLDNESTNNSLIEIESTIKHPTNAIRDTQLSNNKNGFIYHCGLDIFNNHLIRSNTFKCICMINRYNPSYTAFNTIADLMRDANGNNVVERVCFPAKSGIPFKDDRLHIYELDDILSYDDCKKKRLISSYNGWLGFENKSKIKSYYNFASNNGLEIERPLMYKNGGDFVDMYPSRDLYSFVPKYNANRKRIEKNWNYCITYPSSSYTPSTNNDPFSDIIESNDGLNSLKAVYFDESTRSDNGTTQIVIYSISKHGLSKGDNVNVYKTYTNEDGNLVNEKILDNAEVTDIADEYVFTVFGSNIRISNNWINLSEKEKDGSEELMADGRRFKFIDDSINKRYFNEVGDTTNTKYYILHDDYVNIDKNAQRISYKKVVGDIECDYYIRIFSRLPNFKFASGDTSSEYEIYRERENGETMLNIYQDRSYEFENHISKLAFAKNIYSDEIGEIVFTDDIDLSNIHDNLNRPLSSIYLTIIKNNKGYKEWYGYHHNSSWDTSEIARDTVEYSHAFGMVTCGIESSYESSYGDDVNCINRITNVTKVGDKTPSGYIIEGIINHNRKGYNNMSILPQEISYEEDKHFYGDLCCYDNYNAIERSISCIMHRFNTAQRESINSSSKDYFTSYMYDEILYDDYDGETNYEIKANKSKHISNNRQEGYCYIPHYEIPIRTFDKLQSVMPDFLTIRQIVQVGGDDSNMYQFTTLQQHFLNIGDKSMIYDSYQDRYYNLTTISGDSDDYRVFTCLVYDEKTKEPTPIELDENETKSDLKLFKIDNLDIPSYAKLLKDGTCRYVWRNILNNGFNKSDDSIEEYPFTNGAFYINQRIDLYVRRQDPYNLYGLYNSIDIEGNITDMTNEDNYVKDIDIEC